MLNNVRAMREVWKSNSNNDTNPNKNLCALAVASAFHVEDQTRYLHTVDDLLKAVRKLWSARVVREFSDTPLSHLKRVLGYADTEGDVVGYIVWVRGHILAVSKDGSSIVDTAPQEQDQLVRKVWAVSVPKSKAKEYKLVFKVLGQN